MRKRTRSTGTDASVSEGSASTSSRAAAACRHTAPRALVSSDAAEGGPALIFGSPDPTDTTPIAVPPDQPPDSGGLTTSAPLGASAVGVDQDEYYTTFGKL